MAFNANRRLSAGIDDFPDSCIPSGGENILRALYIRLIDDCWVGSPEGVCRCDVKKYITTFNSTIQRCFVPQVANDNIDIKAAGIPSVAAFSSQRPDLKSLLQEFAYEVAANESRCPGDQRFHLGTPPCFIVPRSGCQSK